MKVEKLERIRYGYKVFFDGNPVTLEEETVVVFRLRKDVEINSKQLEDILKANQVHVQKRKALVQLKKPQSVSDFKTYLRSLQVTEKNIDEWTNTYKRLGYLDDLEYGKLLVENYKNKYGIHKIESILKSKGLHPDIIEKILPKNEDTLIKLIQKSCKSIQKSTYLQAKNTIIRQFISKGFDYELVDKYVNLYLDPNRFDESAAIQKEYRKIYKKYESIYQGSTLKHKIVQALRQKGFNGQKIEQICREMENDYVQNYE